MCFKWYFMLHSGISFYVCTWQYISNSMAGSIHSRTPLSILLSWYRGADLISNINFRYCDSVIKLIVFLFFFFSTQDHGWKVQSYTSRCYKSWAIFPKTMHITCHFYFSSITGYVYWICAALSWHATSSVVAVFFKPPGNFELRSFDPFEVAVVGRCGGVLKLQNSRLS